MKRIPDFIPNKNDDMHCVNAVFRMIYKSLLDKDLTWNEIDNLTKTIPGKATWTFIGEMELAKEGLDVINIEAVDYEKLYENGVEYLSSTLGSETAKYYLEKSNINEVLKYIPDYLKLVKHFSRKSSTEEIIDYVNNGYLVGAEVNSSILNNYEGFNLHFILIYDFDGKNLIFHDPGLPPIKSRKISLLNFKKCFEFEGSGQGIVCIKRKQKYIYKTVLNSYH